MTKEELIKKKAYGYAITETPFIECITQNDLERLVQQAYVAGATENGIQWHDLRKDPNDLPDTDRFVHVQTASDTGKAYYDKGWYSGQINGIVIAWCEEPQFKE